MRQRATELGVLAALRQVNEGEEGEEEAEGEEGRQVPWRTLGQRAAQEGAVAGVDFVGGASETLLGPGASLAVNSAHDYTHYHVSGRFHKASFRAAQRGKGSHNPDWDLISSHLKRLGRSRRIFAWWETAVTGGSVSAGAVTGGAVGFGVGSVVPVAGNLIGGGVGTLVGGGVGLAGKFFGSRLNKRIAENSRGQDDLESLQTLHRIFTHSRDKEILKFLRKVFTILLGVPHEALPDVTEQDGWKLLAKGFGIDVNRVNPRRS